ncbi:MAG: SPW repeat protein [Candidatus Magasanikbacteria bacterium]
MSWNNWLIVVIGGFTIISPWVLGFSDLSLVSWNNIIIGSLIVVCSIWNFNVS